MSDDAAPGLRVTRDAGVVSITINRPRRKNALSAADIVELGELLREIGQTDTDRVVVLSGEGASFCAGGDLAAPVPDMEPHDLMRLLHATPLALFNLGKPTIAKVRGPAFGAGMGLALACDFILAAPDARFEQSFVPRGLVPDFGSSWLLCQRVGLTRAAELLLLGDGVDAVRAAEIGIVTRLVAADALDDEVARLAERLSDGPASAIAKTKRLMLEACRSSFEQALETEARLQALQQTTAEAKEGMSAFFEKRKPNFRSA